MNLTLRAMLAGAIATACAAGVIGLVGGSEATSASSTTTVTTPVVTATTSSTTSSTTSGLPGTTTTGPLTVEALREWQDRLGALVDALDQSTTTPDAEESPQGTSNESTTDVQGSPGSPAEGQQESITVETTPVNGANGAGGRSDDKGEKR